MIMQYFSLQNGLLFSLLHFLKRYLPAASENRIIAFTFQNTYK